jgi:hypothetical protein
MRRNEINEAFRRHARDALTPTAPERAMVAAIYEAIQGVLGAARCLQIGSYPRFTAITPLHDLDVLYILGDWDVDAHDPSSALAELQARLRKDFRNPTPWRLDIAPQTHSITISFKDEKNEERMSVDVVPAYIQGKNEFGLDTYFVPEIADRGHRARLREYERLSASGSPMQWIKSDPRGYIEVAKRVNDANDDFRKAVKFVKAWHYACKEAFDSPLKSFHIEQIITAYFRGEAGLDIFGAVFKFFRELPGNLAAPRIPDRADPTKFIDQYVAQLTGGERDRLREARDGFLIKLERLEGADDVPSLLECSRRKRMSAAEAYLFDQGIPVFTEADIDIVANVLPRNGGFREYVLNKLGVITVDRRIEFRLRNQLPGVDLYKWKVKNDDSSPQPRGEITDHQTQSDPEHTKYRGRHWVECYAIRGGACVARAFQNVVLDGSATGV